jgi:hypothetical protein
MTVHKVEFWRGPRYERRIVDAVDEEQAEQEALELSTIDEPERVLVTALPTVVNR